jgi:alanine racemase
MSRLAEIHTNALIHNVGVLSQQAKVPLLAVLKADAYGHGAVLVSAVLEKQPQVWGYAVSTGDEALELLEAGRQKPILLLTPPEPTVASALAARGIRLTISERHEVRGLAPGTPVHIKLNTGMNRLGVRNHDFIPLLEAVKRADLVIEAVYSHLAFADDPTPRRAQAQLAQFRTALAQAGPLLPAGLLRHFSNTGGIFALDQAASFELIRPGIGLYGCVSAHHHRQLLPLQTVMTLKARVGHIQQVLVGESVAYDGVWQAERDSRIAVLQFGYADGYPIHAAGNPLTKVWIGGQIYPVVGLLSMDQMLVDVTGSDIAVGDWAELFGHSTVCPDEVSSWGQTISSQMLSNLSRRVKRQLV